MCRVRPTTSHESINRMMTLSRGEFNKQSIEFVRELASYTGGWTLRTRCGNKVADVPSDELDRVDTQADELFLSKTEQRQVDGGSAIYSYEFSVIFNESYEVPMMYFCVSDQSGCPVPAEEVISPRPDDLSKVVNQVEHPLLYRPFHCIHPCRTADFMRTHHDRDKTGYLVSWLSIIGTLVDLRLDLKLGLSKRQSRDETTTLGTNKH